MDYQAKERIVHVTASVELRAGGMAESVRHLSRSVCEASGAEVRVLALARVGAGELEAGAAAGGAASAEWPPARLEAHGWVGPGSFGYSPGLARSLAGSGAALTHLHGLWKHSARAVWGWGRRTRRPYVVSPHGMLEGWALEQSRWRKRVALWVYQGECLRRAWCLRATSGMEAESIRRGGYRNPICLVPNGVELPGTEGDRLRGGGGYAAGRDVPRSGTEGDRFRLRGRGGGRRRALFLSRIHPKKGLLELIAAWGRVRPAGWELAVAGPDEGGHLAEARRAVEREGLEEGVLFLGEAWGEARSRAYAAADLFVLPSYSENFGLVVAEALAHGLPVIATRGTPWEEVVSEGCGWWVGTGSEPLVPALEEATRLPAAALEMMGARGRRLVERKYAWERIGAQMWEVYEWLLGRRAAPATVTV